jgi:glyoxylase-like metal-dependent hydrolase (beta-lactamase superfamily II)
VRIDRVTTDIFVCMSDLYLQVVATVLFTDEGAVVVDALPFPSEAEELRDFVEQKIGPGRVRYVINTHHHPDHTYGTYVFEGAEVVAHEKCRKILERIGRARLERAQQQTAQLASVRLRLPSITFDEQMDIHLGHRHLRLFHTPGHTADGISVFVAGDRVLLAGDVVMPVPYLVEGDIDQYRASLRALRATRPSFVVQGHGDVLLRGEVGEAITSSIGYIDAVVERVQEIVDSGAPPSLLAEIGIEECGKSRIPLDGMVSRLHRESLLAVYKRLLAQRQQAPTR